MCSLYPKCILNSINPNVFINSWNNSRCCEGKMVQRDRLPCPNNPLLAQLWPRLPASCPHPLTVSQGQSHLPDPAVKMRRQMGPFWTLSPPKSSVWTAEAAAPNSYTDFTVRWLGGWKPPLLTTGDAGSCAWNSEVLSSTNTTVRLPLVVCKLWAPQ